MTDADSDELENIRTHMQVHTGRRLLRFIAAGFVAILMVLLTILFMRFLITGYDRSASAALTRYISLPSLTITRKKTSDNERILRPAAMTEAPVMSEDNLQIESSGFIEDDALTMPALMLPDNDMNQSITLPELQSAPSSEKSKMDELKQAILNGGE